MEAKDVTGLPSTDSDSERHKNDHLDSGNGSPKANSFDDNEEMGEIDLDKEKYMDLTVDGFRTVRDKLAGTTVAEQVSNVLGDSTAVHVSVKTVAVVDKKLDIRNERLIDSTTLDISPKSGVKRRRTVSGEQQSTIHVAYNHLTRASKQMLESLLQQWSEWEAEHNPTAKDQERVLESGEATYFPALRVGLEKASSVSFWIDDETGCKALKGFVPVESRTAPLYDRGFAIGLTSADGSNNLEGGLEIMDDPPRCFNCGSYSHSLKECSKPLDRSAVNSARKQHKAKKNMGSRSRLPSRYYQSSQGGKYDGLKPGSLDTETRQLLDLGELDPPPWLNRMRELGYPPGYLALDDDHPSGITIFGEEETHVEESDDGEISEKTSPQEPAKKVTVEFPGINAPIPESADERLWAYRSSTRSQHKTGRGYDAHHDHHRPAPARDHIDEGPPGVEPSSYPPRYGNRYGEDHHRGVRKHMSRARSPGFGRSDNIRRPRRSPGLERGKRYHSSYGRDFRDRDDRR